MTDCGQNQTLIFYLLLKLFSLMNPLMPRNSFTGLKVKQTRNMFHVSVELLRRSPAMHRFLVSDTPLPPSPKPRQRNSRQPVPQHPGMKIELKTGGFQSSQSSLKLSSVFISFNIQPLIHCIAELVLFSSCQKKYS